VNIIKLFSNEESWSLAYSTQWGTGWGYFFPTN
jgi:hypothetical protein